MALIFDGEHIPCRAHVIDWRAHGKRFTPDMPNIGRRRGRIPRVLVTHWTGGERSNKSIYATLRTRGYGVEFSMDAHGHIWQYADPCEVYTAHAGGFNLYSFGLEMQNQGLYPHPAWRPSTQARLDKKYGRGRERVTIRGKEHSVCAFTLDQIEAYLDFCDALADAEIIPRRVPLRRQKMIMHSPDGDVKVGLLETNRLPPEKAKKFKGVCGHFHVHRSKVDPGTQPLEELIEHWGL